MSKPVGLDEGAPSPGVVERCIDPYVFGLWLGDGHASRAIISVNEKDVDETRALFAERGIRIVSVYERAHATELRINFDWYNALPEKGKDTPPGLYSALKKLCPDGKAVPKAYLDLPESGRLELLRGLMDSDGSADKEHNHVRFSNTNPALIDAVFLLAKSLGQNPCVSVMGGRPSHWSRCVQVRWVAIKGVVPFHLSRKAERIKKRRKHVRKEVA